MRYNSSVPKSIWTKLSFCSQNTEKKTGKNKQFLSGLVYVGNAACIQAGASRNSSVVSAMLPQQLRMRPPPLFADYFRVQM